MEILSSFSPGIVSLLNLDFRPLLNIALKNSISDQPFFTDCTEVIKTSYTIRTQRVYQLCTLPGKDRGVQCVNIPHLEQ